MPEPEQPPHTAREFGALAVTPVYIGGLIFVLISGASFAVSIYLLRYDVIGRDLSFFYPHFILGGIGVFSAFLGVSLLRAAGAASVPPPALIVNPDEWEALKEEVTKGNEEAITQYVRLRSLTGFTGLFTKLGLQGLPLATIGLTLFFSLMYWGRDKEFLDLAKLTLGAFIGSFVQKQVGERQGGGGTVKLPSGESIKVQAPPPSPPV